MRVRTMTNILDQTTLFFFFLFATLNLHKNITMI